MYYPTKPDRNVQYRVLVFRAGANILMNEHIANTITIRSSENAAFLYLLYQFLLDRYKENDFDGLLSRSILEVSNSFHLRRTALTLFQDTGDLRYRH